MTVCWPTAQLEAARTRYEALHRDLPYHDGAGRWVKEPSLTHPFKYSDGVSIWMSPVDLGIGGDFLEQGSVAQQSPGDENEPDGEADDHR